MSKFRRGLTDVGLVQILQVYITALCMPVGE